MSPATPGEDRIHFRIGAGAAWRSISGAKFSSGSRSGQVRLPFLAVAGGRGSASVGPAGQNADRSYLDGYVRQDGGTANDGSTWYWGYDEAAQISSGGADGGQALTFHGQAPSRSSSGESRSGRDPGSWESGDEGAVPAIQLDWSYDFRPGFAAGLSLQYSFLAFDGSQELNTFNVLQTQTSRGVNVTDIFEVGDIVIPQAPYQGTLQGPGPLISNRPSGRRFSDGPVIDRNEVRFFNRIGESLDVRLHQFTLGPTLSTRLGPVQVALGTGLSLNVADWEASHRETLYVKREGQAARVYKQWSDKSGGTDVLPGIYLQLAATLQLGKGFSMTAFGNHDWSKTLSGHAGPSHFTVDPTGWTVGGLIGYSF